MEDLREEKILDGRYVCLSHVWDLGMKEGRCNELSYTNKKKCINNTASKLPWLIKPREDFLIFFMHAANCASQKKKNALRGGWIPSFYISVRETKTPCPLFLHICIPAIHYARDRLECPVKKRNKSCRAIKRRKEPVFYFAPSAGFSGSVTLTTGVSAVSPTLPSPPSPKSS